MSIRFALLSFTVVLISLVRASASTTTRFATYSEGLIGTSFTDSSSGFAFSQPVSEASLNGAVSPCTFYIDSTTRTLAPDLPGNILTLDGYSPGSEFDVSNETGFTITFPSPATAASLDAVYIDGPGESITLTALNSTGQTVDQEVFDLPDSHLQFAIDPLSIMPSGPFRQLIVSSSPGASTGFTNITMIPEPIAASMMILASAGMIRRRRRS